jgi:hypothetical protein
MRGVEMIEKCATPRLRTPILKWTDVTLMKTALLQNQAPFLIELTYAGIEGI